MKVWASASAIGLSMAYFATACSSEPPSDNTLVTAGTPSAAGTPGGGTPNGGAQSQAGTPGGGTPGMAGTPGGGGTPGAGGNAGGSAGGATAGSGGSGTPGACPEGVLGHCKAGEVYPPYDGYTLALVEDFEVPIDLNADPIWTWSDGSPADGQTGFREEQIKFSAGKMHITAEAPDGCAPKTTNAACIPPRMSYAEAANPNAQASIGAMGVWSGEIRTKYNNFRYGRYEAKYTAPIANPGFEATDNMSGNYLSTMFIFRTPKNVRWNEIDIELEPWHHDEIAGNVVNATFPGTGPVGYPAGNASPHSIKGPAGYAITQEHVYAFTWTPTKVEWFVDGVSIRSFEGSANVPIPDKSAKIMMNLWIFSGTTFGDGVNNKFPFTASYDWFRFYKLNSETTYPCANPPSCLPAEDKTKSSQNNPKEVNYGM